MKIILALTIFIIACSNGIVEKPKNLIDKEIMINVLYDLSLIEAIHNTSFENGISNFKTNNYIFKKYNIDSLQFAKSNQYYASDIKNYKKMFEEVSILLSKKNPELPKKLTE